MTSDLQAGPGQSTRIPALDGLRAIAVLLVIAYHYYWVVPGSPDIGSPGIFHRLVGVSYCGVDLFFVLSGFLIGGILLDQAKATNLLRVFYFRRLLRIVPIYLLLLVAYWLMRTALEWNAQRAYGTFAHLVPLWSFWTFTQNIAMAMTGNSGPQWLAPTWSLAIEEQFYLVMPFVMAILSRRALVWLALGSLIVCPALRLLAWQGGDNPIAAIFLTPMRADSLLLGVLCAVLCRDARACALLRHGAWLPVVALGLLGLAGVLAWRQEPIASWTMVTLGYSIVGLLSASCLLLIVLYPHSPVARALGWTPLAHLGRISYFVYLAHTPLLLVTHGWLRSQPPGHATLWGCAATLLAFGVTLLLGLLSWRYLESPLLAFGRRAAYRAS